MKTKHVLVMMSMITVVSLCCNATLDAFPEWQQIILWLMIIPGIYITSEKLF